MSYSRRSSAMAEGLGVVACLVLMSTVLATVAGGVVRRPAAMYVFGDSTLDVGNNNYLPGPDVPRANMPWYGIDFPGSVPTGRFSNGYNLADYVAKNMGFACSPPAYLSLAPNAGRLAMTALATGVSYASAGAGILDSTHEGNNIPLSRQVLYFNATRSAMVAKLGSAAVRRLLSRSVFLFSVGSNDLFVFVAAEKSGNNGSASARVAALYASLLSGYSAAITELYQLGARKFAIINVGKLGCVPAVRVLDVAGACADGLNRLASGFDDALASLLADRLAPGLPGLTYSLADYFALSAGSITDPAAEGFTDVAGACCGGGRLGAEADCLPNATLCGDRDRHVFWDRVHPSQRDNMLAARNFYDSRPGRYTSPISFKDLAEAS